MLVLFIMLLVYVWVVGFLIGLLLMFGCCLVLAWLVDAFAVWFLVCLLLMGFVVDLFG